MENIIEWEKKITEEAAPLKYLAILYSSQSRINANEK